jgi:phosphopantothenoylcysteine synthetase/decarboxylase
MNDVTIARAQDVLVEAQNCVECIRLAAEGLDEKTDPIQYVANLASDKIDAAIAMLEETKTK